MVTALNFASQEGHEDVAIQLLQGGAKHNKIDAKYGLVRKLLKKMPELKSIVNSKANALGKKVSNNDANQKRSF